MLVALLATFNDKIVVTDCILTTTAVYFSVEQEIAYLVLSPSGKAECDEFPGGVRVTVQFGSGLVVSRVVTDFAFRQYHMVEFECVGCAGVLADNTALLTIESYTRVTQSSVGVLVNLKVTQDYCVQSSTLLVGVDYACFSGDFNGRCLNISGKSVQRAYLSVLGAEYAQIKSQRVTDVDFALCFESALYYADSALDFASLHFVVESSGLEVVFVANTTNIAFSGDGLVSVSDLSLFEAQFAFTAAGDLTASAPGGIGVFVTAALGAEEHTFSARTEERIYRRGAVFIACTAESAASMAALAAARRKSEVPAPTTVELRFYKADASISSRIIAKVPDIAVTNWKSAVVTQTAQNRFRIDLQVIANRKTPNHEIAFLGAETAEKYADFEFREIARKQCTSDTQLEFETTENVAKLFGGAVALYDGTTLVDWIQFTAKMIQVNGLEEFWTLNAVTLAACAVGGMCVQILAALVVRACKARRATGGKAGVQVLEDL